MTGWQDISTAPKDGTRIDLWVVRENWAEDGTDHRIDDAGRIAGAWWGEPSGRYFGQTPPEEKAAQWCMDGNAYDEYWVDPVEENMTFGGRIRKTTATHWMPLPTPPETTHD